MQWYEKNEDLFKLEIEAMKDVAPNAEYGFF